MMSDGRPPPPLSGEDGIKTEEACAVGATWVLAVLPVPLPCSCARVWRRCVSLPCRDRPLGAMGGARNVGSTIGAMPLRLGPPSVPVPVHRSAPAARGRPAAKHTPPDTYVATNRRAPGCPPRALSPPAGLRAAAPGQVLPRARMRGVRVRFCRRRLQLVQGRGQQGRRPGGRSLARRFR